MKEIKFAERVIRTADEYYFIAEEQWKQAVGIEPSTEEVLFEFKRLIRAALLFYVRSFLELDLVETDEEQDLEELLEIVVERETTIAEFMEKNKVEAAISEEGSADYSRLFSVAEAMRTLLLQSSSQLAASLPARFMNLDQQD